MPSLHVSAATRSAFLPLTEWCPHRFEAGRVVKNGALDVRLATAPAASRIVDVGSLDGEDAIRFANAAGHHHRVWTFEPSPSKLPPIRALLSSRPEYRNITLHGVALSNTSGHTSFRMQKVARSAEHVKLARGHGGFGSAQDMVVADEPSTSPKSRLGTAGGGGGSGSGQTVVQVPMATLESFDPRGDVNVFYLKIDAQGHDYRVLRGAERLLRERRVRALAFEFCPKMMPGGRAEAREALDWLVRSMKYSCAPCNLNPWRGARSRERASVSLYVTALSGNETSASAFFDDIVCEPAELCAAAGRRDCHVWSRMQ